MKLVIGSIVIFSLVIIFLFALFPAEVSVMRMIQIRARPEKVYRHMADLREWKWNAFVYDAFPSHFPSVSAGQRIDSGYIHLKNVSIDLLKVSADTVKTLWQHGNNSFLADYVIIPQANGQSIVQWSLHFHVKWYPWEKLASMFYEKQLGPLMEKSLLNLQIEMEKPGE